MANQKIIEMLQTGCLDNSIYENFDISQGEILYKELSNFLNALNFKFKDLADGISKTDIAKAYFVEICEEWICYLEFLYQNKSYDARNEESVDKGHILYSNSQLNKNVCSFNNLEEKSIEFLDNYVLYKMSREHRTIQQSFSKLVFYYLKNYARPTLKDEIIMLINNKILDEYFYDVMFI